MQPRKFAHPTAVPFAIRAHPPPQRKLTLPANKVVAAHPQPVHDGRMTIHATSGQRFHVLGPINFIGNRLYFVEARLGNMDLAVTSVLAIKPQ